MESIVKKLFVSGSLLVALAVTLTTITSNVSAADVAPVTGRTKFSLTVENALTLSNVSATEITAKPSDIANGTLSATVSSGSKYTISLSAEQPALSAADITDTINAGDATVNNTWGIQKIGESAYTAIGTAPAVFYTSAAPSENGGSVTDFNVGVRISPILPAGSYSTDITVTAAVAP